jgi:hypothetical protein
MKELDTTRDYKRAKEMQLVDRSSITHMQEATEHRLAQLLLARFLLLGLLYEASSQVDLSPMQLRRLWVLLQVQPNEVFRGFQPDVFTDISRLLRRMSIYDLKMQIYEKYNELSTLLEEVFNPAISEYKKPPFFCVVDESQAAASLRRGEYWSDNLFHERPLLKELFRSWTSVLPPEYMRLVLSGTGIDLRLFEETLSSPAFKEHKYRTVTDLGAFEDAKTQAEYIKQYIPANWSDPAWKAVLDRAWIWLRGRCCMVSMSHRPYLSC